MLKVRWLRRSDIIFLTKTTTLCAKDCGPHKRAHALACGCRYSCQPKQKPKQFFKRFCLNFFNFYSEELSQPTKHANKIIISIFLINFLFNYDFAKLFDHWLNLRKCLLQMHNLTNKDRVDSIKISPDLSINIKKYTFYYNRYITYLETVAKIDVKNFAGISIQ